MPAVQRPNGPRATHSRLPVYATSYRVVSPRTLAVAYIIEDPHHYRLGDNTPPAHIIESLTFDPADPDWGRTVRWWRERSRLPVPPSAGAAVVLVERGAVAETTAVTVRFTVNTSAIVGHTIGPVPMSVVLPPDQLECAAQCAHDCHFAITLIRS